MGGVRWGTGGGSRTACFLAAAAGVGRGATRGGSMYKRASWVGRCQASGELSPARTQAGPTSAAPAPCPTAPAPPPTPHPVPGPHPPTCQFKLGHKLLLAVHPRGQAAPNEEPLCEVPLLAGAVRQQAGGHVQLAAAVKPRVPHGQQVQVPDLLRGAREDWGGSRQGSGGGAGPVRETGAGWAAASATRSHKQGKPDRHAGAHGRGQIPSPQMCTSWEGGPCPARARFSDQSSSCAQSHLPHTAPTPRPALPPCAS